MFIDLIGVVLASKNISLKYDSSQHNGRRKQGRTCGNPQILNLFQAVKVLCGKAYYLVRKLLVTTAYTWNGSLVTSDILLVIVMSLYLHHICIYSKFIYQHGGVYIYCIWTRNNATRRQLLWFCGVNKPSRCQALFEVVSCSKKWCLCLQVSILVRSMGLLYGKI